MNTFELHNAKTGGLLRLHVNSSLFKGSSKEKEGLLTIAWNRGEDQTITVDEQEHLFPANSIVTMMLNQTFSFERAEDVLAWQFNRGFYCIVDHDKEVSCVGLLFYGSAEFPVIILDKTEVGKINLLYQVFVEEFEDHDNLQEDMLRMLLKRLIIKTTRLYKKQIHAEPVPAIELDLVRQFHMLINVHYKEWHQVQDYANKMNKSPKTLSNIFAQYNSKSPLKVLHDRIILEAKRLLIYTDHSVKEIAFELGFEEIPPFNRLFKKITADTPSNFRKSLKKDFAGKN